MIGVKKGIFSSANKFVEIVGGIVTTVGDFKFHTFTATDTFDVKNGGKIDFLLVAGGGGGGSADIAYGGGGGGGAGGLIHQTNYTISTGIKSVTIGLGGTGAIRNSGNIGTNGGNSIFDTYTAIGGGAGGYSSGVNVIQPNIGGSGGGSSHLGAGGANGTLGQGNKGGDWAGTNSAAGGGGATGIGQTDYVSGAGSIGGAGGTGYIFEGTEYAKGGMGGSQNSPISGPTTPNTGNGGDASYETSLQNGNNGADGVFIIKYRYK